MASSCLHVCESHVCLSVYPFLMTSLRDSFPYLPTVLTCNSSSRLTPFVLPCRWVRAAAVRWPSCPQCLEPAGCCWWGWLCPQTTGWSWWRASSCSRTRAWRWRWRCIQASGEFASWLVGICSDTLRYDNCRRWMHVHTLTYTYKQCCYVCVCVHMSTSPQWQTETEWMNKPAEWESSEGRKEKESLWALEL